ncbi:helix-turn-helix domain-containing protein [Amycolatopsis acidiphila]|uniref:Helix-turn-helix domain-containing protein n=1 Tax=Amycolatopsis acidiphila TaxID=715473 RepID=A0A557ZMF8_9PSEU|nr:helix-turn-helix domain-containing protein [Amycolatopsis acidiphila]GHG99859.1 hypothetical protein GCM10017788_80420 [Amycolatopsis acidiphila]
MALESTNRALVVLDMLATSNPGPSIRRVSEQLGLSRSATHRILQSLAEEGYATQSPQASTRSDLVSSSWPHA